MAKFKYLGKKKKYILNGYSEEKVLSPGDIFELNGVDLVKMNKCIKIAKIEAENHTDFKLADEVEIEEMENNHKDNAFIDNTNLDSESDEFKINSSSVYLNMEEKAINKLLRDKNIVIKREWTRVDKIKILMKIEKELENEK